MKKIRISLFISLFFVFLIFVDAEAWQSVEKIFEDRNRLADIRLPPPGVHPRVLFTAEEVPSIREKVLTETGKKLFFIIKWQSDHPGKQMLERLKKGEIEKPDISQIIRYSFFSGFAYFLTEERLYLEMSLELLGFLAKGPPASCSWREGHYCALIYDILYSEMPEKTREFLRRSLAATLRTREWHKKEWATKGYLMGPSRSGRGCVWGALKAGRMAMAWMAIEGEENVADEGMLRDIVGYLKWIPDYSITAEGHMLNGTQYAAGDFDPYGYALYGLQRRGIMLVDHPHLKEFAVWLAYETIPGMYIYDNRNQASGGLGLSSMIAVLAARHGKTAQWLQEQALGPERRVFPDPDGATAAILFGKIPEVPAPSPELPLSRWSSAAGTVFSRSGWEKGSFFAMTMEPPAGSHTHADKGSFTFYSHGLAFAADSGVMFFNPEYHNTVLIDGKGQAGSGGLQGATDAVVVSHLPSALADFTHMDVKPAYDAYLAWTETEGKTAWDQPVYGKGLPFYWKEFNPVKKADRYALYVRGLANPYIVILDDIQKDDAAHRYDWLMHTRAQGIIENNRITLKGRFTGNYLQAETGEGRAVFRGELPEEGEYKVFVLVRREPFLKAPFAHSMTVYINKKPQRYFYIGCHTHGWFWHSENVQRMQEGENTIEIYARKGSRVAQVLVSRDLNFIPDFALTEGKDNLFIFKPDMERMGGKDWSVQYDPGPQAGLFFIQPGTEKIKPSWWSKPRVPAALRVRQEGIRAGFTAVIIPWDSNDPVPEFSISDNGGEAKLIWGEYTDYIFANPAETLLSKKGRSLWSDGRFALVRTKGGRITGYILIGGSTLSFRGNTLIKSSGGPVNLINDGETIRADSPCQSRISTYNTKPLGVVCNLQKVRASFKSRRITFNVPILPSEWQIDFKENETVVEIKGRGPLPLKIHAPRAIRCIVNGVSVWFSRAPGGHIYPKIGVTVPGHGEDPPVSQ